MRRAERQQLLERLRTDAARIADAFGLEFRAIEAEHQRVKSRYGACYEDGLIKIRLNHAKTGRPLKYSSLIDTLCHELAHLRHFDHGPRFQRFFLQLLRWARHQGIYRPAPRQAPTVPRRAPAAATPDRRNGVPVFAAPAVSDPRPWASVLGRIGLDPDDDAPAAENKQLALATASVAGGAAARPMRGATARASAERKPVSRAAAPRQLRLFD